MLPNWLFTQSLVEHELSWLAAEHVDPGGRVAPEVLAALRGSALRTAVLPTWLGGHGQQWEQVGRGLSALGSVCPATAWLAHEHLATLYRLAHATGGGPALAGVVERAALLAERDATAVEIGEAVVVTWPRVTAPAIRTVAALDGLPSTVTPALSTRGYVIRAALASAAINGVATDLLRRIATAGHAPPRPLGAAVTQLLTSQAATFRGLSMLDTLTMAGEASDGAISAAFHTTVRGGVRALLASLEALLDRTDGLDDEPFAWLPVVLRAMARHPVLDDESWDDRVTASLSGDWTLFDELATPS
ncbi:hypothetical protein WEI85_04370 [Actinomycetes bacterium KLBMP 9797]